MHYAVFKESKKGLLSTIKEANDNHFDLRSGNQTSTHCIPHTQIFSHSLGLCIPVEPVQLRLETAQEVTLSIPAVSVDAGHPSVRGRHTNK